VYENLIDYSDSIILETKNKINKIETTFIESRLIDELLKEGDFRLLEVDSILKLPLNVSIKALVTSNDVLHS